MYKEFGKWLRENRKRLGLTQKELAARTNFKDSVISKYERAAPHSESGGDVQPSKQFIREVAAVFANTADELELLNRQGRVLAGWPETDEIPSLRQIDKLMEPGGGVYITKENPHGVAISPDLMKDFISAVNKFTKLAQTPGE
jgi:transcriptional regulator with XRE-family HTH domain